MGAPIPHNQARRLLRMETALGKDVLIPLRLSGSQLMSEGFSYLAEAFSEQRHDLEPRDLVGKAVTLMVVGEDGAETFINGYVQGLEAMGRSYGGQRSAYRLTLVSWLWFLQKRSNCRIFQNKSVPEVLQALIEPLVASGLGKADFSRLSAQHPKHRYLVQYNESDYNALCRWAAREGIAFFITHDNGSHTVHFIDEGAAVPALAPAELELAANTPDHDHLFGWQNLGRFVSGGYTEATYNYNESQKPLRKGTRVQGQARDVPRVTEMEQYRYTEAYHTPGDGAAHVERRMRQGAERHRAVVGTGTYRHLAVGHSFKAHPVPDGDWPDKGRPYTLTRVELRVDEQSGGNAHLAQFEAVPRGGLIYPRGRQPVISGLQTAVVTGHKTGTVYTDHSEDRLGRVKVQFHWDREGRLDENTSCWLRVMQASAGSGVSAFYALPRVGDEVVVAFENGNPDRPFVLGALPNPTRKPPYGDEPTRSGIRTQSFDAGGPADGKWNELRFDDRKGSEEIYLRAEKDLTIEVKHDTAANVGNDVRSVIGNSETRDVGKTLAITAGTEIKLQVGGNTIVIDSGGISITGGAVTINGSPTSIN